MGDQFELTPDQQKAVDSDENMVITACPGSGKTTVVVEKIRKEIPNLENFQGVIGITFTVKASKELKRKCKHDAFDIKSSFFGTIDHFCLSEIIFPFASRIYGAAGGVIECIAYVELDSSYQDNLPNLDETGAVFSTADYHDFHSQFERHYKDGFVLLEAIGIIANHILTYSIACRRYFTAKYTSLYVDEYQDSSQPQHQLFLSLLGLGLRATAVGDVQQSIYAWRGSSPEYIENLVDQPDIFEHHIVNVNHRCHASITNYANRLFSPACELLETEDIRVFQKKFIGTQEDIAIELNTYIPKIAEGFDIESLSDIAVLVRNNRSLDYLRDNINIPFRIYSDDALSIVNTKATNLFADLLKYRFDQNLLIYDIPAFAEVCNELTKAQSLRVTQLIKNLRQVNENGLSTAIQEIAIILIGSPGSTRDISSLEGVIESEALKQYIPSNTDELQIMTLHKSKGLEFEIVFHLDLYDWVFPFREYTGDFDEYVYPSWGQDLNLHYVGITRAKSACILAYSSRRLNRAGQNRSGKPSVFLNSDGIDGLYALING